mmetsp:Transcript_6426/g.11133  ORF Transcript_6426/g.11133 Transcript_6426/m.11133 type:complete len:278 (+) Transcript_6426:154-987(+)
MRRLFWFDDWHVRQWHETVHFRDVDVAQFERAAREIDAWRSQPTRIIRQFHSTIDDVDNGHGPSNTFATAPQFSVGVDAHWRTAFAVHIGANRSDKTILLHAQLGAPVQRSHVARHTHVVLRRALERSAVGRAADLRTPHVAAGLVRHERRAKHAVACRQVVVQPVVVHAQLRLAAVGRQHDHFSVRHRAAQCARHGVVGASGDQRLGVDGTRHQTDWLAHLQTVRREMRDNRHRAVGVGEESGERLLGAQRGSDELALSRRTDAHLVRADLRRWHA